VVAAFDGGQVCSDDGALLLKNTDGAIGSWIGWRAFPRLVPLGHGRDLARPRCDGRAAARGASTWPIPSRCRPTARCGRC